MVAVLTVVVIVALVVLAVPVVIEGMVAVVLIALQLPEVRSSALMTADEFGYILGERHNTYQHRDILYV